MPPFGRSGIALRTIPLQKPWPKTQHPRPGLVELRKVGGPPGNVGKEGTGNSVSWRMRLQAAVKERRVLLSSPERNKERWRGASKERYREKGNILKEGLEDLTPTQERKRKRKGETDPRTRL